MPKFEYRFDLASILLASVLTTLGISEAGRRPQEGHAPGNFSLLRPCGFGSGGGRHGLAAPPTAAAAPLQAVDADRRAGMAALTPERSPRTGGVSGGVTGSYSRFGK